MYSNLPDAGKSTKLTKKAVRFWLTCTCKKEDAENDAERGGGDKGQFFSAPWMSFSVITPFFVQSWLTQFYVSFLKSFGSCQLHQSENYTHT